MLIVHREIERGKSKLAPINHAGIGEFGVVHLLDDLCRNFLRRISVIGRESIEHFFVPNPVLQHLRRRFYEIAGHVRSGKTSMLCARCDFV